MNVEVVKAEKMQGKDGSLSCLGKKLVAQISDYCCICVVKIFTSPNHKAGSLK